MVISTYKNLHNPIISLLYQSGVMDIIVINTNFNLRLIQYLQICI